MAVHATCEADIVKLRDEVRQLEDEYDDSVYDRWILEHQYRMAVARMQEHDPEGIAWLDEQVRRWESRRRASSKNGGGCGGKVVPGRSCLRPPSVDWFTFGVRKA